MLVPKKNQDRTAHQAQYRQLIQKKKKSRRKEKRDRGRGEETKG